MAVDVGPKLGQLINADIGEQYYDQFRPFLRAFDSLVLPNVLSTALTAPPGSPANGNAYLLVGTPSGAWAGHKNSIAVWSTEITQTGNNTKVPGWDFYAPNNGWFVWDNATNSYYSYNGTTWVVFNAGQVIPGTIYHLPAYAAGGTTLSQSNITTDSTGNNLTLPGTVTSSLQVVSGSIHHPSGPTSGYNTNPYNQTSSDLSSFGAGWSLGNAGVWSVTKANYKNMVEATRGITQLNSGTLNKHAVGDTAGIYVYTNSDGGVSAQSDEGVTAATFQQLENKGYFHGTVSATSGTGDQAPTLAFTSGNNWTTDGAFLLNITKGTLAGNMNGDAGAVTFTTDTGAGAVMVLTAAAAAGGGQTVYTGTIPHGASNALFTAQVTVAGFTNSANNGNFVVLASTGTTITLSNGSGVAETHAATATFVSNNFMALPVTGVTLPVSTAIGIVIGPWLNVENVTADSPVSVTTTVALQKIGGVTGVFTIGSSVTIAGIWYPEQTKITAAVNNGDGTQTLTFLTRNPNQNAVLFQGGIQGQYISFDANLAFSGMRSSYYAYGSLTGSDLIYGHNVGGNTVGAIIPEGGAEAARTTGGSSGFHLYPGAEVVCNTTTGAVPTLEQNSVHWAVNDVVENPHFPSYGGAGLFINTEQQSPSNFQYGQHSVLVTSLGTGLGGNNSQLLHLVNGNPVNYYIQGGGPLIPPVAVSVDGPVRYGFRFTDAWLEALVAVGAPSSSSTLNIVQLNYASPLANGTFLYDNVNHYFQFQTLNNTGAYYHNGSAGASGTFTTVDSKTVTVAGGIITSIV